MEYFSIEGNRQWLDGGAMFVTESDSYYYQMNLTIIFSDRKTADMASRVESQVYEGYIT